MSTRFTQIVAVHLFLMKEGQILIARRHNTGYQDGNFSVPAGHVEEGETCLQAMVREANEEVGISVRADDLHLVHVMHRKSNGEHRVDFFFSCSSWMGDVNIIEPDKCDLLEWASPSALPENMVPYVRQAIAHCENRSPYSEMGFE